MKVIYKFLGIIMVRKVKFVIFLKKFFNDSICIFFVVYRIIDV